jgi:hypothetical protein
LQVSQVHLSLIIASYSEGFVTVEWHQKTAPANGRKKLKKGSDPPMRLVSIFRNQRR